MLEIPRIIQTPDPVRRNFADMVKSFLKLVREGHVNHWASIISTHAGDNGGFHFIACCPVGKTYLLNAGITEHDTTYYYQGSFGRGSTPHNAPPKGEGKGSVYDGFRLPIPTPRDEREGDRVPAVGHHGTRKQLENG